MKPSLLGVELVEKYDCLSVVSVPPVSRGEGGGLSIYREASGSGSIVRPSGLAGSGGAVADDDVHWPVPLGCVNDSSIEVESPVVADEVSEVLFCDVS